jgi:hypothetical protein
VLLLQTLVAASWLVIHVRLLTRSLRSASLSRGWRALAIVPPFTPFAGWRAHARGVSLLWAVHGLAYGLLHSLD